MQFIKLITSDSDTRWINLSQVSRVTIGEEPSGEVFAAVIFSDGDVSDSLKIHGSDDVNREAIHKLGEVMDSISR